MPQRRLRLRRLSVNRVDLVDAGANQGAHVALFKREGDNPMPTEAEQLAAIKKAVDDASAEAVTKTVEYVTACYAAQYLDECAAFQKAVDDAAGADDITKRKDLPEEVQTAIAKERAERETLEKRLADVEKQRRVDETTAIAKGLPFIGESTDDLGALLLKAREQLDDATYAEVTDVFSKSQARIAAGELFKTKGRDGEADLSPGLEKIEKRAAEIVQGDPKISKAQAMLMAARENSDDATTAVRLADAE